VIVEKEIIDGCRKGSEDARKVLYERYYRIMFGICIRYLKDPDEAKDVVQEGFIKIFMKINQYKNRGSFEGWMKRIMVNYTIDYKKKQAKTYVSIENSDIDYYYTKNSDNERENGSIKRDKSEILREKPNYGMIEDAQFSKEELLEAMHAIPDTYSVVFNLHCIEGLSHAEIGKLLNIDEKTSRTRLLRARRNIQEQLYKMCVDKIGV
jgi:RNA polymerase sigma-70 factor, ECF subfamily